MSVLLDNANSAQFSSGAANSVVHTCGAGTTLLALAWGGADGGGGANPTSVTFNSLAMTHLPGAAVINGLFATDIWYMINPPTGTPYSLVANLTAPIGFQCIAAASFTGTSTVTPFGTPSVGGSGSGVAAAVTASGAGASDLYLAVASVYATALTSGGSQTRITSQIPQGVTSQSIDTLPGSGAGAFSWTGGGTTSNGWAATGVAILAGGGPVAPAIMGQICL